MVTKKKIIISAVITVLIISLCISIAFKNRDKTTEIKDFINEHSYTIHKPPSGWGGESYRAISFSDTKTEGIGYSDEYFCLYSKTNEKTYVEYYGWIEYVVYCEIVFMWENFGEKDFFARIIIERKDFPGDTVGYAEATDWGAATGKLPGFTKVEIFDNSTEIKNTQIKNISILTSTLLVRNANDFLEAFSLPVLY